MRASLEAAFRPLTVEVLRKLNARTQIDGDDPAVVARDYLRDVGRVP
jgi:osmoprotectant transport system substrate-binding protein